MAGRTGKPARSGSAAGEGRPAGLRQKAEQLAKDTGIAMPQAWAVVRGQTTINAVLTRMAQQDRARNLQRRHGLEPSQAAQVALGQLDLDLALRRQREREHLAQHRGRDLLAEARDAGRPLLLHVHGLREVEGRVVAVEPFRVQLEGGEWLDRVRLKWLHPAHPALPATAHTPGERVEEPILRPQDRPPFSDRRLFDAHFDGLTVRLHLAEGDRLRGIVAWVGRYDLGLRAGDAELVVCRHALRHIEEC